MPKKKPVDYKIRAKKARLRKAASRLSQSQRSLSQTSTIVHRVPTASLKINISFAERRLADSFLGGAISPVLYDVACSTPIRPARNISILIRENERALADSYVSARTASTSDSDTTFVVRQKGYRPKRAFYPDDGEQAGCSKATNTKDTPFLRPDCRRNTSTTSSLRAGSSSDLAVRSFEESSFLLDEETARFLLEPFYGDSVDEISVEIGEEILPGGRQRPRSFHRRTYRDAYLEIGEVETVQTHSMGRMSETCASCGARYFQDEVVGRDRTFTLCCKKGKVTLEPLRPAPEALRHLLTGDDDVAKDYRQHIRHYNSSLAFASFNADGLNESAGRGPYYIRIHGQVHHFTSGAARPRGESVPQYNQLYFLDVEMANKIRQQQHDPCQLELIARLEAVLSQVNPYYHMHRKMSDVMAAEEASARQRGEQPRTVIMSIKTGMGRDPNIYNLPVAQNEVAAVFVGEEPPMRKDLRVYPIDRPVQTINNLSPEADPMVYPLLFPHGEPGYSIGKEHAVRVSETRHTVTCIQFYTYKIMDRDAFSILHHSGKLFQQYVVDSYCKAEADRLWFIKRNQDKFRVDEYQGLMGHLERTAEGHNQRVGKVVILPSSFYGSSRQMYQTYQDSIAIMRRFGKPDLFITFTCNPNWPEIQLELRGVQEACHRPDLVCRVFKTKLDSFIEDINVKQIFGVCVAFTYSIEFQKRGLPHCHLLVFLHRDDKVDTPEAADRVLRASIPSPAQEPLLHEMVKTHMLHKRCGPKAPCYRDGKCRFNFPKSFSEETDMHHKGFVQYKSPNDGTVVESVGRTYDNRHVVPYSPYLLKKYAAHINVEICSSMQATKYLFKYIFKGHDRATIEFDLQWDEVKSYLDCRYVSSPEACWRLFAYKMQDKNIVIVRLNIHLPDRQSVLIRDNDIRGALERSAARLTHLTSFFDINHQHKELHSMGRPCSLEVCPLTLTFVQFPQHYSWMEKECRWKPREKGGFNTLGRVANINPMVSEELFHLRTLLHTVRGPTSFEHVKTVHGRICATFKEACQQLLLLESDDAYATTLLEAATWQMPSQLRALFVHILIHCNPASPVLLFQSIKEHLIDTRIVDVEVATQEALSNISTRQSAFGKSCGDFGLPEPRVEADLRVETYDAQTEADKARRETDTLNDEQRALFDSVVEAVRSHDEGEEPRARAFFVDGPGGSGKTYVYNVLMHQIRGMGRTAQAVAWTGIAAILLEGGKTSHGLFRFPVPLDRDSVCNITVESPEAQRLKDCSLIVWDEAPMAPCDALHAADRLLRDVTGNDRVIFGGKVLLLGGDFRQVLPVVRRGGRAKTVQQCLKYSPLWDQIRKIKLNVNMRADEGQDFFKRWLLQVGEGRTPVLRGLPEGYLEIPQQCVVPPDADLCTDVFGDSLNEQILSSRAILCPRNEEVDVINDNIVKRLGGEVRSFLSTDVLERQQEDEIMNVPIEFLHSLNPPGLPPHELKLTVGAVVMLLRNMDTNNGLCNGTRLTILRMQNHVLDCKVLMGSHAGQRVLLPRIKLSPSDLNFPFSFSRKQFPISLAFALTINKSQGQTFERVGIYLPKPVFSHGQLYVALSRARRLEDVRIQTKPDPDVKYVRAHTGKTFTMNVVYPEVL